MFKKVLPVLFVFMVFAGVLMGKTVITYANWNLGLELETNIVQEFMKAYPDIEVRFAENIDYGKYIDSLNAAAASGKLPDVIMIPNIPMALTNEWALDIKDMVRKDIEWMNVPTPLRTAASFGEGVYAVPAGMYFMGYFVNDDLFKKYNVSSLSFSPTWQSFMNAIRTLSNPAEKILGLCEEVQIPEWYPASLNADLGWFTWDGAEYNLDGKEFMTGVKLAKQLYTNKYVFDSLTEQEKKLFNAGWYGEAWDQGEIAVRWSGSWDINGFKNLKFNSRFIGVPGGRTPVVGDFMVISSSTKNAEAAYKFIRYITFAREGMLKRLEIDEKKQWSSLPLTTEKAVINKYFEKNAAFPGIKEAFATIDSGIIEGVKIVPGYIESRWTSPTGVKIGSNDNANIGDVIWNAMRGNVNIADYASALNTLAGKAHQSGYNTIISIIK